MLETIGNTPLVRLRKIVPSSSAEIWLKIEGVNPTGSYKDRMALAMIKEAEERGAVESMEYMAKEMRNYMKRLDVLRKRGK